MARSKDSKDRPGGTAAKSGSRVAERGYGKPPAEYRWPKGVSGNPAGRPRKADKVPLAKQLHPVRDMVLDELQRPVTIKEGGRTTQLETLRAIVRSVNVGAMKGEPRQQKMAYEFASAAAQSRRDEIAANIRHVESYKAKWDPIFASAARSGHPEPRQLPHPDHVNIDMATGEMIISGPITPDEKQHWDFLMFELRKCTKLLEQAISEADAHPRKRSAAKQIAVLQQHLGLLEKAVPEGWNWREVLGWEKG